MESEDTLDNLCTNGGGWSCCYFISVDGVVSVVVWRWVEDKQE